MYAFSKNLLVICSVLLGHCMADASQSCRFDDVVHHAHVYTQASDNFFQRPELVQQCLSVAMYNAQFGLIESFNHYDEKDETISLVCKTEKSWIGLLLDLEKKCIYMDSRLDTADERRFFAVKQLLDVLFGDYIYSKK